MTNLGYKVKSISYNIYSYCYLTIGSIIIFNGEKCIVTHTNKESCNRMYKNNKDITIGKSGYLKNILTGKEFRADWSNITEDKIIFYEKS